MRTFQSLLAALMLLMSLGSLAAVEVNTASEADLDSMRGLGPDSTARILKAREAGPFANWQDLMHRVKGIKQATARKLSLQGLTRNGEALDSASTPPKP